jgi:hypothetical protein
LVRTSTNTSSDGSFTFTIISGVAPFTYTISGPNGYINTGTLSTSPTLTLNGLVSGDYTITIVDDNGNQISQNTTVNGPLALFADARVTKDSSVSNTNDGEITITNVGGGSGTYTYVLFDNNGTTISSGNITTIPLIIPNLAAMTASNGLTPENFGYYLVVTDSDGSSVTVYDLVVNGPTSIIINVNKTDVLCFGDDSGQIELSITGGNPPYSIETLGADSFSSNSSTLTNLTGGTFTTTVTDDYGTQASVVTQITIANPEMVIELAPVSELNKQCDPTQHEIKFYVTTGGNAFGSQIYTQYSLDGAEDANGEALFVNGPTLTFVNDTTPLSLFIPAGSFNTSISIRITNQQGTCFSNEEDISISEVALPIVTLNANITNLDGTTIDNSKQCTPNFVTFKVNISHLQYSMNNRGPYELKFKVNNGAVQTRTITTNQQVITSALPSASTTCTVQIVSVTDNVGCVSPSFTLPTIQLPAQALSGSWTTVPIPGSTTTVKKFLPISGGVQPYTTVSGYAYYDNTPSTMYTIAINNTISSTIQDSIGCSITVNG